jgi:hypothetical protein
MAITWGNGLNDAMEQSKTSWRPPRKYWFDGALNLAKGSTWAVDSNGDLHEWPQYFKQMTPGQTVSLWLLEGFRKAPLVLLQDSNHQWLALWKPLGNKVKVSGNDTPEQYEATSKKQKKGKQYGKGKNKGGKGEDDAKEAASFVKTDGWDILANAPMLSVNYPDQDFLALQTDPYYRKEDKAQDSKANDAKASSSNPNDKVRTIKDKTIGGSVSGASRKRKTKISDTPQEKFPTDKMRLGFIEQDIFLHSDLASNQGYQSKQKAKKNEKGGQKGGHRFRFKFHYNPASVMVSQTYNQDMDPLFVQKDAFSAIQSGSEVSFSLFLNRIEEMQILNHDGSYRKAEDGRDASNYAEFMWRGKVRQEIRSQIRTMGTLYDLEYLYRVCNGEPLDTWKGKSSDYGILFGQPMRLHFTNVRHNGMNVGMNYYGFISSISMDHKMFSMDMVPSLTEVGITFTRIPDTLALNETNLGKAFSR